MTRRTLIRGLAMAILPLAPAVARAAEGGSLECTDGRPVNVCAKVMRDGRVVPASGASLRVESGDEVEPLSGARLRIAFDRVSCGRVETDRPIRLNCEKPGLVSGWLAKLVKTPGTLQSAAGTTTRGAGDSELPALAQSWPPEGLRLGPGEQVELYIPASDDGPAPVRLMLAGADDQQPPLGTAREGQWVSVKVPGDPAAPATVLALRDGVASPVATFHLDRSPPDAAIAASAARAGKEPRTAALFWADGARTKDEDWTPRAVAELLRSGQAPLAGRLVAAWVLAHGTLPIEARVEVAGQVVARVAGGDLQKGAASAVMPPGATAHLVVTGPPVLSVGLIFRQGGQAITDPSMLPRPLQVGRRSADAWTFGVDWVFDNPEPLEACLVAGVEGVSSVVASQAAPTPGQAMGCWRWRMAEADATAR